LLQRSLRTRHGEFERTRNVHARIRLEKLDTSSQVQDSSAGLKVEKSASERRGYGTCYSQALNEKMSGPSTDGLRTCCPGPNWR
jgi:hypothetical protein